MVKTHGNLKNIWLEVMTYGNELFKLSN